jgi:Bacteriocin-protection, YdeI or OmpD-Associated/Domain of unknown function (DUF1905)
LTFSSNSHQPVLPHVRHRLGSALNGENGLIPAHRAAQDQKTGNAMKKYKFKAKIEPGDAGGAYVLFPYDTEKEFATKGKVPVKVTFNGVPYTGPLIKYGKPLHVLGMPKAIRVKIGKGPSDTVEVVLWKDEEVRTVEVPAQFQSLMKKEGLLPVFKKLSYTHRKEYCRWITEAKKQETRLRRLNKAIEMLRKGVSTPG